MDDKVDEGEDDGNFIMRTSVIIKTYFNIVRERDSIWCMSQITCETLRWMAERHLSGRIKTTLINRFNS